MKITHQIKLIALAILINLLITGCDESSVSNYNIVWDSPSADYKGTMPIGNGETGLNVWVEPNGDLVFLISRTDSWDENERPCKLGRVRVKFTPGLASSKFKQVLKLGEGEIEIVRGSGDEAITMRTWVDANRQVIHIDADSKKAFEPQVELELWREKERTLGEGETHGVSGFKEPRVYPDTVIAGQENRIVWYHRNPVSPWKGTLQLQGLQSAIEVGTDPLLHRTFGGIIHGEGLINVDDKTLKAAKPQKNLRLSIHTHTQTPATEEQWLNAIEKNIAAAGAVGRNNALKAHRKWWRDFWNRSWIYASSQEQPGEKIPSIIPSNKHNFKFGIDQHGHNKFTGELGRATLLNRALNKVEIEKLASRKSESTGLKKTEILYSETPALHSEIKDSSQWTQLQEMTFETWIKPAANTGSARILDKVTPGTDDGILLDTHPGDSLRLIVGTTILSVPNCLEVNDWNHVAVVVDSKRHRFELFLDGKLIAEQGATEYLDDAFAVTRGYVLQRWISACGGRGNFPIKFNGTIFTVNDEKHNDPDYRRWGGCYWFQNTRLPYWPMLASGDYDMMRPLFRMFVDALPLAKIRTPIYFGHEGAFFPETMSFWGTYENGGMGWGWRTKGKPGDPTVNQYIRFHYSGTLELLAMMIDYYNHTGDKEFLKNDLLPIADEYLLWWDKHWDRDANGKLKMYPSYACESFWNVTNPTPDVAGLMWDLNRLLELSDTEIGTERRAQWTKFRKTIPPIPMTEIDAQPAIAQAEGKLPKATNSENPNLYAVFPFRIYGVGKDGLEMARHTFKNRRIKSNKGWRQDETQAAFLGLADTASEFISGRAKTKHDASRFPAFWGPNFDWIPDQDHGGNILMGLQTMILQADNGTIHLLPAWPKEWDCSFKLHAPGKTIVQGTVKDGKVINLKVTPKSRRKDIVNYLNLTQ